MLCLNQTILNYNMNNTHTFIATNKQRQNEYLVKSKIFKQYKVNLFGSYSS